jgi:hypothetical protein
LGTFLVPREILFRAKLIGLYCIKIGNGIASASAFPSATWERGKAVSAQRNGYREPVEIKKKPNNYRRLLLILLSPFIFIVFCLLMQFLCVIAIMLIKALGNAHH